MTTNTMSMTGGEAIVEILARGNVGPMFGMGGFQLLPFYEAVRRKGLTHHLINDERCGAFAADAWARVSGRPGVCDATLGPGATNLVTALVESLNAGVPQVVFTGNTHRDHSWKNMTQESRQADILRPAVKDVLRIERASRVPELVRRAFQIACSGRPGPVVVDVPEDIAHEVYDYSEEEFWIDEATTRFPTHRFVPDSASLDRAAEMIRSAARPVLLVGGGIHVSQAYDALAKFSTDHLIPVAHTLSGKGSIACVDPLSLGLFGRYSRIANEFIAQSDCVVVVGCKLGEVATKRFQLFKPSTPILHLDIVPEELGRTTRTSLSLVGDASATLGALSAAMTGDVSGARQKRAGILAEIEAAYQKWLVDASPRLQSSETPINMARMLSELNAELPADGILVADGGFAAHWAGLLYDTKKAGRGFVADRGFASIGYGLPGSMGAQLARPESPVFGITGDGGFNMVAGELETAKRIGTPFTLMIVNNAASGYIKALQHAMYGSYQSSDLSEVDYSKVANDYGCHGIRVENPGDLKAAIRSGIEETGRPTVIDVVVTRDPSKMLPGVDNRVLKVSKGDRPV